MALADAEGFTQFDAPGQCARAGIEPVEAKPGAEEVKFIRGEELKYKSGSLTNHQTHWQNLRSLASKLSLIPRPSS